VQRRLAGDQLDIITKARVQRNPTNGVDFDKMRKFAVLLGFEVQHSILFPSGIEGGLSFVRGSGQRLPSQPD
jgi:hypothetical protein